MKIKMNLNRRDFKVIGITLLTSLFFGWIFFHSPKNNGNTAQVTEAHDHENETVWTCSMHPQIRMDEPGQCPICGMDLVPLQEVSATGTDSSPGEVTMTETAMKIADIQTMVVRKANPDKEVYLLGKVKPDERNIAELTARYGGRIETLFVNFTGQNVRKGEKLATIYSPALITAQKELLEARGYMETNPDLYRAARNKLRLWNLTDEQIDNIEKEGEVQSYFDVLSPITGTVTQRNVAPGDYVKEGSSLLQVVDLTRVWVMFEAYESDLPWIKTGDLVNFTLPALPGENYSSRIGFIDPVIDPTTRIAKVRVEVQNPALLLKPEMLANGTVTSSIAANQQDLLIPKTAVLWTGKRAVVYVKEPYRDQPTFRYNEITLGPSAGKNYVVNAGLQEGQEIAINGVFKIDAAAQLAGKSSMMNPQRDIVSLAHNNSDIEMNEVQVTDLLLVRDVEKYETVPGDEGIQSEIAISGTDPQFTKQLTAVYSVYLTLKNAFIDSDPGEISRIAEEVNNALGEVDMGLLEGETHIVWMDQLGDLTGSLEKIMTNRDIAIQREAFADFITAFYQSVKEFGLEGVTIYYQYCPMAVDNTGAYWLSEIEEIRNPYFGNAMLTCGETRETMEY